jgi:hypothetical protein
MAFRHGRHAKVKINSVDLSAFSDEAEISLENDTAETTTFGNAWKRHIPGLNGAGLTLSGDYDPTASTGPAAVLTALIGDDAFPVEYYPGGEVAGQIKHAFNALLTAYSESSPVGDKITFSASLIADGADTVTEVSA